MSNDEGKENGKISKFPTMTVVLLAFLILQIIRQRRSNYFYDHL